MILQKNALYRAWWYGDCSCREKKQAWFPIIANRDESEACRQHFI